VEALRIGISVQEHAHLPAALCPHFLTVSMDTVDPMVFKQLRGGASVGKVLRNVTEFHKTCPTVRMGFITTVTKLNIGLIDPLIDAGLEAGVAVFNLRQVIHNPDSPVIDHSAVSDLTVPDAAFADVVARVQGKYGHVTRFCIQEASGMRILGNSVRTQSMLPGEAELARIGI